MYSPKTAQTRIKRDQHRFWPQERRGRQVRETSQDLEYLDTLPYVERIRAKQKPNVGKASLNGVNVKLHFFRPVTFSSRLNEDVGRFLEEFNNNKLNRNMINDSNRNYSNSLSSLKMSYFSPLAILTAINSSRSSAYDRFGSDRKQTRDTVNRLKGSYMSFIRDNQDLPSTLPIAYDPLSESLSGGVDAEFDSAQGEAPYPLSRRWSNYIADVSPYELKLGGKSCVYFAFNLNNNEDLVEEREDLRRHFLVNDKLNIQDLEYDNGGMPVPYFMHITFAKLALRSVKMDAPYIPELPLLVSLGSPDVNARAYLK